VATDYGSHQVDVMNHQIQDDGNVGAARVERGQPVALDEAGRADVRERGPDCPIEALDMTGLHDDASAPRQREQLVSLLERHGDGLLDQYVLAALEGSLRDGVVGRRRDDDRQRVGCIEQLVERSKGPHGELRRHGRRPLARSLVETDQPRARDVAQDADMVVAERPGPDDANAHRVCQMTTPRFVSLTKRMNSCTSGSC
jgi:hypothetical protein